VARERIGDALGVLGQLCAEWREARAVGTPLDEWGTRFPPQLGELLRDRWRSAAESVRCVGNAALVPDGQQDEQARGIHEGILCVGGVSGNGPECLDRVTLEA
jgi:hypothetical protein